MNQTHVMLDLETFGDTNEACIVSIGAVRFDSEGVIDRFHVGVDPVSCQSHGGEITAGTMMWWLAPERDAARAQLMALERLDVRQALGRFLDWYSANGGAYPSPIWGNGATFDNVIMRSAFKQSAQSYPAPYWLDRCYRTVKSLAPHIKLKRVGTHHSAVDDAESQALHLIEIARELGLRL